MRILRRFRAISLLITWLALFATPNAFGQTVHELRHNQLPDHVTNVTTQFNPQVGIYAGPDLYVASGNSDYIGYYDRNSLQRQMEDFQITAFPSLSIGPHSAIYSNIHNKIVNFWGYYGLVLVTPRRNQSDQVLPIRSISGTGALNQAQDRLLFATNDEGLVSYRFPSLTRDRVLGLAKWPDFASHPSRNLIGVADRSRHSLLILDGTSFQVLHRWNTEKAPTAIAFHNSNTVLLGGEGGWVHAMDFTTGNVRRLPGDTEQIRILRVHPSGRYALAGKQDGEALLYNLDSGQIIVRYRLDGRSGHRIYWADFSPDGKKLYLSSSFAYVVDLEREFANLRNNSNGTQTHNIPSNNSQSNLGNPNNSPSGPILPPHPSVSTHSTVTTAGPSGLLRIAKSSWNLSESIEVSYTIPQPNAQDWITIVPVGTPENQWGQWTYTRGNRTGVFRPNVTKPGQYEIRLYFNWPQGKFQVQDRIRITVHP